MFRTTHVYPEQHVEERHDVINIGKLVNTDTVVGIPYNSLGQHVIILGATGSGKTTTTAVLVSQISRLEDIRVLVIDWHGEYRRLIKCRYINPYRGLRLIFNNVLADAMDVFEEVLELTPPQSYIMYKTLREIYGGKRENSVDVEEILTSIQSRLEESIEESSGLREAKYALVRKLSLFERESARDLFSGEDSLDEILYTADNPVVLDVSLIREPSVRKAYTLVLLKQLLRKRGLENKYRVLVVLEEAHNLMPRGRQSFLSRYVAEVRKYGIVLVIVTQSPSSIIEDAMKNTGTKIIHSIRSAVDLEMVSKLIKLPLEYEKLLPVLEPGEAIFYNPVYKKPLLIRVDKNLIKN